LIDIQAASVNDWDLGNLEGWFVNRLLIGLRKPRLRALGCDVAGTVAAVGKSVTRFAEGDEVYGDLSSSGFGAFAEYVCAPETALAEKPSSMSFQQAAALPHAAMLALQALRDVGQLENGQRLLLNGAGGGVGTLALQMARRLDADVTAVDGEEKLERLLEMGARQVIDYRSQDFTRTGERYDLIVDVKTNRSPFAYARALNPRGSYVTLGGSIRRLLQIVVVGRFLSLFGGRRLRVVALEANKDLDHVNDLFEAGELTPVIDRSYQLSEVKEAFWRFARAEQTGKIVLRIG